MRISFKIDITMLYKLCKQENSSPKSVTKHQRMVINFKFDG